jgi:predicted house-cleaning noncanonical NTP pyrophosphatase (MazG superfamily)
MINNKSIFKLKKRFLDSTIEYNMELINLKKVFDVFFHMLKNLNINLEEVITYMNEKNSQRGEFKKKIVMHAIYIPITQMSIIKKYFYSNNNIYNGHVLINNNKYYCFITEKAIRDSNQDLLLVENISKVINNDLNKLIAHIMLGDEKLFAQKLKQKLMEEAREVLYAQDLKKTLEELADVYTILVNL